MSVNTEMIQRFYSAFQRRDHSAMNACYAEEIVFSDPAFGLLYGDEVRNMWEMLCTRARDLSLDFSDIVEIDDEYATCKWVATYTFSGTGRRVENHIKAFMRFRDGKIIEHSDAFKLSKWAAQALGWKGLLFGWSGFLQRRIQKNARKSLVHFAEGKK
jgi:ketosteroid isomerase-like protein